MGLVYDNLLAGQPGTHVLAIGVGKYPHLIDGDGKLAGNPLGLGQLKSPPVSAARFIDWCMAPVVTPGTPGFVNADAPLASVEVLISAQNPLSIQTNQGLKPAPPATRDNIQQAFEDWLARVSGHPGNIGVFYFCGHGVMVSDHYLLAEDFGHSNALPWMKAFDVTNTLRAAEREVHGSLYFLIDACRVLSREIALTLGANPSPLKVVELKKPVTRASASLIEAAGEGDMAFADVGGQVSRFTSALITAMSGYCGVKGAGAATWDVDGETLAAAVRRLLQKDSAAQPGQPADPSRQISDQAISGSSVPLLRLTAVPNVKVELDLIPEQYRAKYEMYLSSARGGRNYTHKASNGVWQTEVPRGFYEVGARDNTGEHRQVLLPDEELVPPLYDLTLQALP